MNNKNGSRIKSLAKSFKYAFLGLFFCIKNERNMRIHIVATIYVLIFSKFYNLTRAEYAVLFVAIALVILCEMLNTAIELSVDIKSPQFDFFAGKAKDVAAGAVLICAILAVCVGAALFFDTAVFYSIFVYFKTHLMMLTALIISVVIAVVFIIAGPVSYKSLTNLNERNHKDD